jgi:hypothetical protein
MRGPVLVGCALLAACKPPPTDADILRAIPEAEPVFASEPLPSPDTEGALWAASASAEGRLVYGIPGQPALLALECVSQAGELPRLAITRLAPADEEAGALLAMVGNGHIGRIAVDATELGGRLFWRGEALAADAAWEPLGGPRELIATVPGAGTVELNPSPLPGVLIERCRNGIASVGAAPDAPASQQ